MIRTISGGDRGDCGAGGTSFAIEAAADPPLMKLFPHCGIDARQAAACAEVGVGAGNCDDGCRGRGLGATLRVWLERSTRRVGCSKFSTREDFVANAKTILAELKKKASAKTRAIYAKHGLPADRTYGVSVADMKTIAKSIKGRQDLACELYGTGIVDAMYLAGMVVDGKQMSAKQLEDWARPRQQMPSGPAATR